jgi:hypothetical protein
MSSISVKGAKPSVSHAAKLATVADLDDSVRRLQRAVFGDESIGPWVVEIGESKKA